MFVSVVYFFILNYNFKNIYNYTILGLKVMYWFSFLSF